MRTLTDHGDGPRPQHGRMHVGAGRPPTGLTAGEAARRLATDGPNALPPPDRPSLPRRAAGHLREPMTMLLLAAAGISGAALGEWTDAAAIAVIVVLNVVIALIQEGRAEHALDALEALEAPQAVVVRGGRTVAIPAREVVVGDVVLLSAGDRVPADLRLVETASLEVDESLLTGESLAVAKSAAGETDPSRTPAERAGAAFSGTLVTRGTGRGVVSATGSDTALGEIAADLRRMQREPTPLQIQLAALTSRLGIAAVIVAAGTFALVGVTTPNGLEEAFLTAVALAVAAVPEGLAPVTTVALALGVGRMARRGAIVRRLPAVETLGATDTLVIDKTGTVTENRMEVAAWLTTDGAVHSGLEALPAAVRDAAAEVAALCNEASLDPVTGDPTEVALLEAVGPDRADEWRRAAPRVATAPFTSERMRMSAVHRGPGGLRQLVKGAPEAVLSAATCQLTPEGPRDLNGDERERILDLAHGLAEEGKRLLALADRELAAVPADLEAAEEGLRLVALAALRDPPRASAPDSVQQVRDAGVTLVMATGDHPATAAAIAREVGLADATPATGAQLRDRGFPSDPRGQEIYARVDPGQKLELVELLQARGHTVAMTGDGVNDAPALRRADIGVALGRSGSDVAREASDLVITDDDLATIVAAVREGRGIYDNLRKVVDYLVASNLAEILVVLVGLLVFPDIGIPLLPLQLLWINLLTDGLPALALGVDPVDPTLMTRPPRDASARLLDLPHLRRLTARAAVLGGTALIATAAARGWLDLEWPQAQTLLFTTVVLVQILYAFAVRQPAGRAAAPGRNRWLWAAAITAVLLQVAIVTWEPARRIFDITPLPGAAWALAGFAAAAPIAALVALHSIRTRRARSWT